MVEQALKHLDSCGRPVLRDLARYAKYSILQFRGSTNPRVTTFRQ